MTNPYFNPSGNPSPGAAGLSALMRAEFASVSTGFSMLPAPLIGNAGKLIVVNSGESGLAVSPIVYPGPAGPYLPVAGGTIVGPVILTGSLTISGSGVLILTNLATSSAGLPAGTVWNNGGFLCVA